MAHLTQALAHWRTGGGLIKNELELGVRYHIDDVVRFLQRFHSKYLVLNLTGRTYDATKFGRDCVVSPGFPDQCMIPMQQGFHLLGGQKQIITARIRFQETKPVGMADDRTRNQVCLRYNRVLTHPVHKQLGIAHHRRQTPA